jgi:hypothetical protein
MATNTYIAIETKTIAIAATSVEFTVIPQGYKDLFLSVNATTASDGEGLSFQVGNGTIDTTATYSRTLISGANDTLNASSRSSSASNVSLQYATGLGSDQPCIYQVHFMNYSNATTYKTFLVNSSTFRGTSTNKKEMMRAVALWRSTSAIDRIKLTATVNMNVGSTFTLYGIAADTAITSTAKATGGTITYGPEHTYHVFTAGGTFTPSENLTCDYVIVGGGGGGGNGGGGGGAGGYRSSYDFAPTSLESQLSLVSGVGYTVTVGSGGAGGVATRLRGDVGIASSIAGSGITTITAAGGGSGGGFNDTVSANLAGGSGGGGSNSPDAGQLGSFGAGTAGQGNDGGKSWRTPGSSSYNAFGGGGGAKTPGTNGSGTLSSPIAGVGGIGFQPTGATVILANGGLGGSESGTNAVGAAGATNTGNGGGGGKGIDVNQNGGAGGSGIVIIRYAN